MNIQSSGRVLIYGLFRKKAMILGLNLGILGTVLLGSLLLPPAYEASSTIIIRGRNYQDPLFPQRNEGSWTVLMNPKEEINSEIEIMVSRPVLEKTVEAFHLDEPRQITEKGVWGGLRNMIRGAGRAAKNLLTQAGLLSRPAEAEVFENAVITLKQNLRIDPAMESQVIRVSYRDRDPAMAGQVVNGLVQEYLRQHLTVNLNRSEGSFFLEQISHTEKELHELQERLVQLKSSSGILSMDEQVKTLVAKLNTFDMARTTIQKEIISKRTKIESIRKIRKSHPNLLIPLAELTLDTQMQDMENKLVNLRYELKSVLQRYTPDSRQVKAIQISMAVLEAQIIQQVTEMLEREEVELRKLEAEDDALTQTVDGLKSEVRSMPAKQVALGNLENEITDKEAVLSILRKKYQDSLVAQATDFRLENAKIVSPASIPLKPSSPNLPLNMALAFVFSLVASFSLALFLEYIDDSLRIPEDIERSLKLPILHSVPEL